MLTVLPSDEAGMSLCEQEMCRVTRTQGPEALVPSPIPERSYSISPAVKLKAKMSVNTGTTGDTSDPKKDRKTFLKNDARHDV